MDNILRQPHGIRGNPIKLESMKRVIICIFALSFILPGKLSSQVFQVTPVTISTETTTRDGVKYRVHNVLDHQTLFSICKAYEVTLQDVIGANKDLDLQNRGLKTGDNLLIPVKDSETVQGQNGTAVTSPRDVPAKKAATMVQDKDYFEYVAKWYEDLTMIAARFNIPKKALMEYNGMKSETITRKQKIRIPKNPGSKTVPLAEDEKVGSKTDVTVAEAEAETDAAAAEDTGFGADDAAGQDIEIPVLADARARFRDLFRRDKDRINVGIILPFNARGQINDSAYDLYSGILMALKDLSSQGIKSSLSVLDSRSQSSRINEGWLDGCDIVIGPISPDEIRNVLEKCNGNTPVISPLDPKALSLASQYSNFIQAPSSTDAQLDDIVEWIKEDKGSTDKVILLTEKGARVTPIQTKLENSGIVYATVDYDILGSKNAADRIESLMTDKGTNRAVIASDNEAFVNDAIRNLNLMTYKKLDVVLYAPSKFRSFETVEIEGLHNIHSHISCSYFVDYDSGRVKNFLLAYRAIFGAEPTPFAYQGYDAAYYFIRNFTTKERDYERIGRMGTRKYRGLQSDFQLDSEDGETRGYANKGIRRVIYNPDFSIKLTD